MTCFNIARHMAPDIGNIDVGAVPQQVVSCKSSAAAAMGDRLATIDMDRGYRGLHEPVQSITDVRKPQNWGRAVVPLFRGGSWAPI